MEELNNTQSADKEVFGASRLGIFEWLIYGIILLGVIGAEAVVMLNFGHVYGWNGIGVLAQIGAVAGGFALLVLPMKIYKATALFTPQWWMSIAFLLLEAAILGGNVIVAYNTMSGVELSTIEQSWRHVVPATSLIAVFGAAMVFISNPNARVVATEMAAKIITATSRAEELADNARAALRRSRLERKRMQTKEEIETSAEITKMQNEAALVAQFQSEYLSAAKQDPAVIAQLRAGARERARIDSLRITGELLGLTIIEGKAMPMQAPTLTAPVEVKPVQVQPTEQPAKPGTPSDRAARGWQKAVKRVVKAATVQAQEPAQDEEYDIEKIRAAIVAAGDEKVKDICFRLKIYDNDVSKITLEGLEGLADKFGVSLEYAMKYAGLDPRSVRKGKA